MLFYKNSQPNTIANIKHRTFVLLMAFIIFFVGITARLAYIQFSWSDELRDKAEGQWTRELGIYPKRGTIYDCNGIILAASVTRYSLQAIPNDIKNADSIAVLLSPIIDMTVDEIYNKISDKTDALVWVKRLLTDDQAQRIRDLAITGLELIDEPARVYPFNNLASQVLGFTMKYAEADGHPGQEGIELYYNDELIGEPGVILRETDNTGKDIPYGSEIYVDAQNGNNITLTLDSTLQSYLQEAAEDAMLKSSADGVYAMASNPYTGEIYAMVNLPDYDPNEPPRNLSLSDMQALTRNMTCQMNFEPGSTFKAVILAAALEEGVITMEDTFYCPGYYVVDGVKIHCSHRDGHGWQTTQLALSNSCNPAFIMIGEKLGKDLVYEYLEKFGFGQKTGINIAGEENGIMIDKDSAIRRDWLTMCFGQAIAVTPIQLMTAFNALINGGYIIEPNLLKEINKTVENDDGSQSIQTLYSSKPVIKRQVISKKTSDKLREILIHCVAVGTGFEANVDGYSVGGKTGTSQTYDSNGNVNIGVDIASFIGFGPADSAPITVYIIVDNPKGVTYGSVTAAPFASHFFEKAFSYYEYEPSIEQIKQVRMANLVGLRVEDAIVHLNNKFFDIYFEGEGNVVVAQSIKPGQWVFPTLSRRKITLTLTYHTYDPNMVQVPNLSGMTLLQANSILSMNGLVLKLGDSSVGTDGLVVEQDIIAGTYVNKGTVVTAYYHRTEYPGSNQAQSLEPDQEPTE